MDHYRLEVRTRRRFGWPTVLADAEIGPAQHVGTLDLDALHTPDAVVAESSATTVAPPAS